MAPIVGDGMRALMEFELPEIELPRIKKAGSGRDYDDVYKPVSSLFKLAAEKMVTNAIKRLQEAQWKKKIMNLVTNQWKANTNHRTQNIQTDKQSKWRLNRSKGRYSYRSESKEYIRQGEDYKGH